MAKAKVFVTRVIPEAGLARVVDRCNAEIWPDPQPPSRDVLMEKIVGCEGLLSTLNDPVDEVCRFLVGGLAGWFRYSLPDRLPRPR